LGILHDVFHKLEKFAQTVHDQSTAYLQKLSMHTSLQSTHKSIGSNDKSTITDNINKYHESSYEYDFILLAVDLIFLSIATSIYIFTNFK
jgi:hypothetical protein